MIWAASLVVAAWAMGGGSERRHIVIVSWNGECAATFDGRPLPNDEYGYPNAAALKVDKRPVRIIGSRTAPYKCVGGMVYNLQAKGFRTGRFFFDKPR